MTKEEILNGMSEEEFYQLYPTKEAWEQATQMKLGGLSGAPHNGQPTAAQFFNYGSHALDKFNIPFGHFAYGGGPIYPAKMGGPCYECGGLHKAQYGFNSGVNYGSFSIPMQQGGIPGFDPMTGVYSATQGAPDLTPAQLESMGMVQDTTSGQWKNPQGSYVAYKKAYPGDPFYKAAATPTAVQSTPVMPAIPGNILSNTSFDTSLANPVQQVNTGKVYKARPILGKQQAGGDPTAVWLAGEQMALQKKTKTTIPSGTKPIGTNPLNFNPFMKGSDIAQPDSMHTSPYNPNIAAYFKGSKVIAGPAQNTGKALQEARALNRGKMYVKDDEVFPDYMREMGGAYDPSNAGTYPMLDFGGLKSVINAAAKHMKKAYGGDLTEQGGNQDYKKQYRATFDNYIKQNTYNAIVDAEQQAMMDELQQMPFAQYGRSTASNMICTAAGCFPNNGHVMSGEDKAFFDNVYRQIEQNSKRDSMANQIAQKQGQQQTFFGNLADMYAPTVNRNQMSVFGSLFPANFTRGYELSNKDYARLKEMGDQGQVTGITENYGPLARLLGKTGRRMFGPKSVTIGMMGPGSASEQQAQPVENVGKGAYDNPLEGMEHGELFKDHNVGVTQQGKQKSDLISSNLWKQAATQTGPKIDPWTELMNAEQKSKMPMESYKMYGGYQTGGNPVSYSEVNLKRKYSGQDDLWKYAPGAFNFLAAGIEQRHDRPEMKAAQLAMMTPGSDIGPFQSVPATGRRMGDYDPNSGMFRPNQMIPVQFPGGNYGYSQMGGDFSEDEELDLSPEEIAELRAQGYEIEELD